VETRQRKVVTGCRRSWKGCELDINKSAIGLSFSDITEAVT
jgi:hypothetical protein